MKKDGLLIGLLILGLFFGLTGCGDDDEGLPAACSLMCKANERCAEEEEAWFSISECRDECLYTYESVVRADCVKDFNEYVDCVYKAWGSSCDFDEDDLIEDVYEECEDEIEDYQDCREKAEDMPL